jgi:hypothetical protein
LSPVTTGVGPSVVVVVVTGVGTVVVVTGVGTVVVVVSVFALE